MSSHTATLRKEVTAIRSTGGRRNSALARRRARTGFFLTLPALVLVTAVVLVPIGFAIWISLNNWPLFGDINFTGISNYVRIFNDPVFLQAIGFTLLYVVVVTPPIVVFGYLLAAFVRSSRPGTRIFRTLFFLPTVVGLTTLSFLYFVELRPSDGLVNVVLGGLHITNGQTSWQINWVTGLVAVSALVVWFGVGTTMMLLLGGMQSVSPEIYEAAMIDGANAWQRETRITLPLIRRSVAMALVLSVIGSFLAFQQFLIVTGGGPGTQTTTIVMWVYHKAFVDQQIGTATAMGVVVMLVVALLTSIQLFLLRDKNEGGTA